MSDMDVENEEGDDIESSTAYSRDNSPSLKSLGTLDHTLDNNLDNDPLWSTPHDLGVCAALCHLVSSTTPSGCGAPLDDARGPPDFGKTLEDVPWGRSRSRSRSRSSKFDQIAGVTLDSDFPKPKVTLDAADFTTADFPNVHAEGPTASIPVVGRDFSIEQIDGPMPFIGRDFSIEEITTVPVGAIPGAPLPTGFHRTPLIGQELSIEKIDEREKDIVLEREAFLRTPSLEKVSEPLAALPNVPVVGEDLELCSPPAAYSGVSFMTTQEPFDRDTKGYSQAFMEECGSTGSHSTRSNYALHHLDDKVRSGSKQSRASRASTSSRMSSKPRDLILIKTTTGELQEIVEGEPSAYQKCSNVMGWMVAMMQRYSMPLCIGVAAALVWSNIDEHSYHDFIDKHIAGLEVIGHKITLHFIVNDIFMCFFFGLAIKEVAEALLPGGSLSPLKRAANPLLATIGGVGGPAAVYAVCVWGFYEGGMFEGEQCSSPDARRLAGGGGSGASGASGELVLEDCTCLMLLKGWGVPTATDISLAWMFAVIIFGQGHPAINFMLLLAILDDAIGMAIIAVFYGDPDHPVEPQWLLGVCGASVLAFLLRKIGIPFWWMYVLLCAPISWVCLLKAHVHPALALVFVVPLMPASHALIAEEGECNLGACDLGPEQLKVHKQKTMLNRLVGEDGTGGAMSRWIDKSPTMKKMVSMIMSEEEEAPMHKFEAQMKLPVDLGMFFFGLANAGVKLDSIGTMTYSIIIALVVGKTLGIAAFSLLGVALGFGLPVGLSVGDLVAMSCLASVGLTVALFVADSAFPEPGLKGQAKMGAVLSVGGPAIAWTLKILLNPRRRESVVEDFDDSRPTSPEVEILKPMTPDPSVSIFGDDDGDAVHRLHDASVFDTEAGGLNRKGECSCIELG